MSKSELEFAPDAERETAAPDHSIAIPKAVNKQVTKAANDDVTQAANDDDGAWPLIAFPRGWWASS